jgi:hypothetical protein
LPLTVRRRRMRLAEDEVGVGRWGMQDLAGAAAALPAVGVAAGIGLLWWARCWPAFRSRSAGLMMTQRQSGALQELVCSCAIRDLAIGVCYVIRFTCYVLVTAVGQREHC